MFHLLVEAFLDRYSLIEAHLVQEDHCSYLVLFLVDEEDIQVYPSYVMDEPVSLEDILLDVGVHVALVVHQLNPFYLENGALIHDLRAQEVHSEPPCYLQKDLTLILPQDEKEVH